MARDWDPDVRQLFVHLGLQEAEEAAAYLEVAVQREYPDLVEEYRLSAVGITDEHDRPVEIDFEGGAEEAHESYRQHIRKALFVALYSLFEDEMEQLCDHIAEQRALRLRARDLSDRGITRSRNYMKKVLDVEVPDDEEEWSEIAMFGKIRNIIAHRGGRLDPDRELQLADWLRLRGIGSVVGGDLALDESAHEYAAGVMRDFWTKLFRRNREAQTANGA